MMMLMLITVMVGARPAGINTPEELIRAMHDRYAATWYKTLTFKQKTTNYSPEGEAKVSIWYESMVVPGKLRIDFDPVKDGNGLLFANDTQYSFKDGNQTRATPRIHPLMVLGFDIYQAKPEETLDKIKKLGFDLTVMHDDTWQGRPVYVVGAKSGDLHAPQFWIDKQNLYFVRLIQPSRDGAHISETQFNKYVKVGKGWVSPEVIFMTDGKTVTTEEYTDMKADVALDDKIFDPQHWKN
jgi:hypothetical protein